MIIDGMKKLKPEFFTKMYSQIFNSCKIDFKFPEFYEEVLRSASIIINKQELSEYYLHLYN